MTTKEEPAKIEVKGKSYINSVIWKDPKSLIADLLERSTKQPPVYIKDFNTVSSTTSKEVDLDNNIIFIKRDILKKIGDLIERPELEETQKDKERKDLENKYLELNNKLELSSIKDKLNEKARERLFDSDNFKNLFSISKCPTVVFALDIRRSTQLMLDAKDPFSFAQYISSITENMKSIILSNFGIFDKFTGDGILAYFPYYYSGKAAIGFALKAAAECHKGFLKHFKDNSNLFNIIRENTGLGIGIDFGEVNFIAINNIMQIVGRPVVYACRLSKASSGVTLLNQTAYAEVDKLYKNSFTTHEKYFPIQHEDSILVHRVDLDFKRVTLETPNWDALIKEYL